ncbi:deoxyribonuclease-1-like [Patiria miniata]|uniref:Endonuclease/exonuclease/phosphatase domain-containing protein n=1 Tax=Patiria miniata TaxID=46514 RepID=A0A914BLY5_PATMI|nr:deoxyribonuclease-1-like [Patiria miniata]
MAAKTILYVTFLLSCSLACISGSLLFGAFNVQTLGVTKMGKPEVVDYLTEILARYDVVLIQELRDASGEAIVDLLNALNEYSQHTYDFIISSRMGRSSYKEQYVYFYNPSKVSVIDAYEYPESHDEFERQPFIVRFQKICHCFGLSEFAVAGIHIKPDDAVTELDYLSEVYDHIVDTWGLQDVMIAGDFNADCSYVSSSKWSNIRLRTESRFAWLISDSADTTVSSTDCAYDRIVVAGSGMIANSRAAATYYFDSQLRLDQTTILSRYDLVMVQELRSSSPDPINELLSGLNQYSSKNYGMVVGPREGRSSTKEQYVFFYRTDLFRVKDQYAYVEKNDEFEREPYIVRFESLTSSSLPTDFAVVNIHTKPGYKYTRYEVDALADVYDDVVSKWGLTDVIITGDYNADCDYVKASYWPTIRLRTESRFYWLTPDEADTTVSNTDCAYDRFVLAGSKMTANLPSSRVFYFDNAYGLDQDTAKTVSDHYPIELTF